MPSLTRLIEQLWVGHTVFTPLFIPGRAGHSIQEHDVIIAALAAHNSYEAASAMREHIERGSRVYFEAKP